VQKNNCKITQTIVKQLFQRVLLKISGEVLGGPKGSGIDPETARQIVDEIAPVHAAGMEIGLVIGGGNIMRGAAMESIPRTTADTMGMLATVINSLAFKEYLEQRGVPARVMTAVHVDKAGEYFTAERARYHLGKGRIVIFSGGTGNPFFTTDTAAALRCAEIGADVLLKATKVDGIYDSDPTSNPNARRFGQISHEEALSRNLKVMDATAFSFCMEHGIPIVVFKLMENGNFTKCIEGLPVGSIIKTGG